MRMALVAAAVLVVGLVGVWIGARAPPPSEVVDVPVTTGRLASSSLETTESPPVVLGGDHLWPETPRDQAPAELAGIFARDVLSWESPDLSDFGHPHGRVWVRIDRADGRELVDVLTAPSSDGGRVIVEAGVPWGHGVDISPVETGGIRIALVMVPGAVEGEITIHMADGSQVVETVNPYDPDPFGAEFSRVEAGSIRSVLIRYHDDAGGVVGVNGTSNPHISQVATPSGNQAAYVAEGETLLNSQPTVVLGTASPGPRFDTTDLGEEVTLAPITDVGKILDLAADITYPHADIIRVTVLGTTPQGIDALVVHSVYDDPELGPAQSRLTKIGSGGGGFSVPMEELEDEPAGIAPRVPVLSGITASSSDAQGRGHVQLDTSPNASVVVMSDNGEAISWQRPVDRTAIFVLERRAADVEFVAFDSNGRKTRTYSGSAIPSPGP